MTYNADVGTLLIRTSKTGKPRHVILTDEARDFFESLTAGRDGNETAVRPGMGSRQPGQADARGMSARED